MAPERKLVLIEDDPADATLLQHAATHVKLRFSIEVFHSGEAALESLRAEARADDRATGVLVLLDLNLPGISGMEVLRTIRETPSLRHIPVIVMSGSHYYPDVRRAYAALANAYIEKPFGLADTQRVLRDLDRFWGGSAELP